MTEQLDSARSPEGEVFECPICFSNAANEACKTTCGHIFCSECLAQSFPLETPTAGKCPLCRHSISLFSTVSVETGVALRQPRYDTIWGGTYLQGGEPGLAAYHFESETDCYISYESAPSEWKTDDGIPLPSRMPFTSSSYDPVARIFKGVIDWSCLRDGGVTINGGDAKWEYEMHFSESFNIICGGILHAFGADESARAVKHFPDDLLYWRAPSPVTGILGSVYMQGGRVGTASYHFESADECYISYAQAPDVWLLDNGSPPPSRKPFLSPSYDEATRTFTGVIDWTPTSFGGEARWEYTMVFSEDLKVIAGGQVRMFKADGREGTVVKFARPQASLLASFLSRGSLFYERYNEEEMEMQKLIEMRRAERTHRQGGRAVAAPPPRGEEGE